MPEKSTTPHPVALVQVSFDAHRAGGIEAALPFYSDNCTWDAGPGWVEDRIYHGHDGLRMLDGVFRENFEDYALTVPEIRDLGERVLALYEATGRIKGSGSPIRQPIGIVFSGFNDGKIGEARSFFSWREALEAVGLGE
jgi:ketosteroid isomerase-like protein